jgi:hypothetical protein
VGEPTWPKDNQLHDMGFALGSKFLQMFDKVGVNFDLPAHPDGLPTPDVGGSIVTSVTKDAEDFASLDPQRIMDAYFTVQGMANATAGDGSEARANLQLAHSWLSANWHGEAARAFAGQMTNIENFMVKQKEYYLYGVQALGTAFVLSVRVRENFINLTDNTIAACQAVIDEQVQKAAEAQIDVLEQVVKAGMELVTFEKGSDLAKVGIEIFLEIVKKAKPEPIDTSGALQVVDSYVRVRDRLRNSYDNGLNELKSWLGKQESAMSGNNTGILAPLPVICDIDGPRFTYTEFYNENHDPKVFGPTVEQERQKHLQEKQQPPGEIGQRLDGEGER